MHYLHTERDLAHMDLKPENILLDDNMVPKIADFGTSRLFDSKETRIITKKWVGSWYAKHLENAVHIVFYFSSLTSYRLSWCIYRAGGIWHQSMPSLG